MPTNLVNHPKHYNEHPSGVECIEIKRYLVSSISDAFKYIWRHSLKGNSTQDLNKSIWYILDDRENGNFVDRVEFNAVISFEKVIRSEPNLTICNIFNLLVAISSSEQRKYVYDLVIKNINDLKEESQVTSQPIPVLDPTIDHCDLDNL